MKRLRQLKFDSILSLMLGLCFLTSFVGGCSAKLIYQINNNEPIWLNSVVVAIFLGLFFCSWGLFGVLTSIKLWARTNRFIYKIGAVLLFLFYSVLPLFSGLYVLWIAIGNLINLL